MGRKFMPTCLKHGTPREGPGKGCKTCKAEWAKKNYAGGKGTGKKYYEAHRAEILDRIKKNYAENPDPVRARVKKWQQDHPEKINEYGRAAYKRNAAKKSAEKRAWKKANPEAVRLHTNRRRALMREAGELSVPEWLAICESQEQKCFDCGLEVKLTIGHIIPLCKGGGNRAENIIAQCQSCNSKQGRSIHPLFAKELE